MTFQDKVATTVGEWVETHKPIVVAVDGSERNRSAVAWAAAEAAATDCEVVLVTAVEDHLIPVPQVSFPNQDEQARAMLDGVVREVRDIVSDQTIRTEVVAGSTVDVLMDRSQDARLVVVGKRGLGTFARVIVGSTSIALAGRSRVPVAIIPDAWKQEDHHQSPVVLGIDPYRAHHTPIHLAFSRAKRFGVPLVAVHGWETPTVYTWDAAALSGVMNEWEQEAHAEFDKVLDTWRARFQDVEVKAVHRHGHPAMAVLEAAEDAQLVVLGRHTDGRWGGFSFGSVARAVLHYSECPVIVVPCGDDQGA